MTRRERIRRVAILCCHCLRNLAFYKAGWRDGEFIHKKPSQFWINVNGNFIDICVLEWCKLFGLKRDEHYWEKVITDRASFFDGLIKLLSLSKDEFEAYVQEVRSYRDKFIAHLDSEKVMNIPKQLLIVQQSASYLYDYLLANEDEGNFFPDTPASASSFYNRSLKEGESVYLRDE
jgi:hypothetical protein